MPSVNRPNHLENGEVQGTPLGPFTLQIIQMHNASLMLGISASVCLMNVSLTIQVAESI